MKKHKQRWLKKVYKQLCKYQGDPETTTEEKNMREWAASLGTEEAHMFQDGMSPAEAVWEEMQCAS